jgi:hypothetical protein
MFALDVPVLESLPGDLPGGMNKVTVFLDFDGTPAFNWGSKRVHGPWGDADPVPAFSLDADSNNFSLQERAAIHTIFNRVAAKFAPFNINVTTIAPASFDNGVAMQVVIGGTKDDWLQRENGGVAHGNSFTDNVPNVAFVFSKSLINDGVPLGPFDAIGAVDAMEVADAAVHELGHSFGLNHQAQYDGSTLVDPYRDGTPEVAPIMGGGATSLTQRSVWDRGTSSDQDAAGNHIPSGFQDDLDVLTRPGNAVHFRDDDLSEWLNSRELDIDLVTGHVTGQGIIERTGDKDAFHLKAIGPEAHFTINGKGMMLAPTAELILIGVGPAPQFTREFTEEGVRLHADVIPGRSYVLRIAPRDPNERGSIGAYGISGTLGGFAGIDDFGVVHVYGVPGANSDIVATYQASNDTVLLSSELAGGTSVQMFPRSLVTGISFELADGNNMIELRSELGAIPVTVMGGRDRDEVYIHGTSGVDRQGMIDDRHAFNNATPITLDNVEKVWMSGFAGADAFDLIGQSGVTVQVDAGGGNDAINIAPNDPFGAARVRGLVEINGEQDDDTLYVGSGNADAAMTNIRFNGGEHFAGDKIVFDDHVVPYVTKYDIGPASVTRQGLFTQTHELSGVENVTIQGGVSTDEVRVHPDVTMVVEAFGNDGTDYFQRGNGRVGAAASATFHGGGHRDVFVVDDRANPNPIDWKVTPDALYYGGIIDQWHPEVEEVRLLAGSGANEITFDGYIDAQMYVDGGDGFDKFLAGNASGGKAKFGGKATLLGGGGDDSFIWHQESTTWEIGTPSGEVKLDGGDGYNSMLIDDAGRDQMSYRLYADRLEGTSWGDTIDGYAFDFDNMSSARLVAGNDDNFFDLYGTSSDLAAGNQFTIEGGRSNDVMLIHPHDAAGNLAVNGNIGFGGGIGGLDSVVIDDRGFAGGIAYTLSNEFGPSGTNVGGMGLGGFGAGSTVEAISVYAGQGDDALKLVSKLASTLVSFDGGDGSDTVDYSLHAAGVTVDLAAGRAALLNAIGSVENAIGSGFADQLIGDLRPNRLAGGGGRDLVIGGASGDSLLGDADDDLVIAGGAALGANAAARDALMLEWLRNDASYAQRVAHITGGGGLNGATLLNRQTYDSDEGGNTLLGDGELDLFFGSLVRDARDFAPSAGETFVDVDGAAEGRVLVDATPLSVDRYFLDSLTLDPAQTVSLALAPGLHNVQTMGGGLAYFTVTADGLVDYAPNFDGIFAGRGTTMLRINGTAVDVDARLQSSTHLLLDYVTRDPSQVISARMLPGSHSLQVWGGTLAHFMVTNDGNVDYDPASEGIFTGRGTSTLHVNGAPIHIDATRQSSTLMLVDYMNQDPSTPFDMRLLPGWHGVQVWGGSVAHFEVLADGTLNYEPALEGILTGRGTTSLGINGAPVHIDASALSSDYLGMDYMSQEADHDFDARLLPGVHHVQTWGGDILYFTVTNDGKIEYDPALEGVLAGRGTASLVVRGRTITVDASESGGTWVNVNYSTHDVNAQFSMTVLPGPQTIVGSTGVAYNFNVANDGRVGYSASLEGILTGRGTTALGFNPHAAVIPEPAPADFDQDGLVTSADLARWGTAFGASSGGDVDGDNDSDGVDFLAWQLGFESVGGNATAAAAASSTAAQPAAPPTAPVAAFVVPVDLLDEPAGEFGVLPYFELAKFVASRDGAALVTPSAASPGPESRPHAPRPRRAPFNTVHGESGGSFEDLDEALAELESSILLGV